MIFHSYVKVYQRVTKNWIPWKAFFAAATEYVQLEVNISLRQARDALRHLAIVGSKTMCVEIMSTKNKDKCNY